MSIITGFNRAMYRQDQQRLNTEVQNSNTWNEKITKLNIAYYNV